MTYDDKNCFKMSDTNLPTNSCIELSDIRKLDILLTQCESSSYENICNDCCAKLGSLEDDDDRQHGSQDSGGSMIIGMPKTTTPKLQLSGLGDAKDPTRNRYDVMSNVPTIISSHVSTPNASGATSPTTGGAGTSAPRNGRTLQKSSNCGRLSFDADYKALYALAVKNHQQSASAGNTYCTKCGGTTTERDKRDLGKKRYFSLDKERNENATNLLQCLGRNGSPRGGSENVLHTDRKQCSFDSGHHHKSSSLSVKPSACEKCDVHAPMTSSKSTKKCGHRNENAGCFSRSHHRDKSNKSSENSLRDTRSRKNSIFLLGNKDDGGASGGSIRSKWTATQHSRKVSTRGPNLHEEFDAETREILLGGVHSSKFEQIKIPEPVEAVGELSFTFSFVVVRFLFEMRPEELQIDVNRIKLPSAGLFQFIVTVQRLDIGQSNDRYIVLYSILSLRLLGLICAPYFKQPST